MGAIIPICILAIEDDDDRAFMAELYLNYRRLMYKEILRIVHNEWEAEDVFQTAIEKLIGKVKELRQKDRDHLVSYLIVTSRHVALNALRNGKNSRAIPMTTSAIIRIPPMTGGRSRRA